MCIRDRDGGAPEGIGVAANVPVVPAILIEAGAHNFDPHVPIQVVVLLKHSEGTQAVEWGGGLGLDWH